VLKISLVGNVIGFDFFFLEIASRFISSQYGTNGSSYGAVSLDEMNGI
jgi:hypothetical protein